MKKISKKINLRIMIALVAVIALPLSFVAKERRRRAEQERANSEIVEMGGKIGEDTNSDGGGPNRRPVIAITLGGRKVSDTTLVSAHPLLELLPELEALDLRGSKITDAGLARLEGLKGLRFLCLAYVPTVTDSGIGELGFLSKLEVLNLDYTKITLDGLYRLKGLKNLRGLELNGTDLSDTDLERLAADLQRHRFWPQLKWINLSITYVTGIGVKEFNKILPDVGLSSYSTRTRERP